MLRNAVGLAGWIALVVIVMLVGVRYMPGAWYASLVKPRGTPPNWLFGPVWTFLYLSMAVAAWLVWRTPDRTTQLPLALFVLQLALNAAWSWLFFGLHLPAAGFMDILMLWIVILACIVTFRPISAVASWLLVPYLVWVSYAAYLNAGIWWLNRGGAS